MLHTVKRKRPSRVAFLFRFTMSGSAIRAFDDVPEVHVEDFCHAKQCFQGWISDFPFDKANHGLGQAGPLR